MGKSFGRLSACLASIALPYKNKWRLGSLSASKSLDGYVMEQAQAGKNVNRKCKYPLLSFFTIAQLKSSTISDRLPKLGKSQIL